MIPEKKAVYLDFWYKMEGKERKESLEKKI